VRRSSGWVGIKSQPLRTRAITGLVGLAIALVMPASASANNLFSLNATPESPGAVVTEASGTGTGYFVWEVAPAVSGTADTTMFCKIPRAGTCTSPVVLPLPGPGKDDTEDVTQAFPVLGTRPGVVYVVGPRYDANDTIIWTSTNSGVSFSGPVTVSSYGGKTGIDDVLLNPLHTATEKEPTADFFDVASTNPGLAFAEVSNTIKAPEGFSFNEPGPYADEGSLGFTTGSHLPVEAYYNLATEDEIHFYVNKATPTDQEKNWEALPKFVAIGKRPRLASGPSGLFMLSMDFPAGEGAPAVLDLRKFNETTGVFEAPLEIAGNVESGLDIDIYENPETGDLYVVWPIVAAGNNVLELAESTNGGQSFQGEREVAAINGGFEGPPRLAVASDGRGWLTYNDEGGVEVANLATNTTVSTSLSGGGANGASIVVPSGTPVTDTATIGGQAGASAAGSVTYEAFASQSCSGAATAAGSSGVSGGVAGASSAVVLAPGRYYWRASYGGDAGHEPSTSPCGSEVLTVLAPTSLSTIQSGGGIDGASLTEPQGTPVSDQAHLAGTAAAGATGTVTYDLYKDSKCTVAVGSASTTTVAGGVAGASAPVKPGPGTYYWKASYSGDSANEGSTSSCGSEVLIVAVNAKNLGLPSTKICLSRRHFLVHPRAPKGVTLVSVEVQINGKFVKKGKLNKHATNVSLVGLPKGTFKIALITRSSKGKVYEEVRTFHTCVPGKHPQKK
jgi:hypothetical protein